MDYFLDKDKTMKEFGQDARVAEQVVKNANIELEIYGLRLFYQGAPSNPRHFDWNIENLNVSIGFSHTGHRKSALSNNLKRLNQNNAKVIKNALETATQNTKELLIEGIEEQQAYNINARQMANTWQEALNNACDRDNMVQKSGIDIRFVPPPQEYLGPFGQYSTGYYYIQLYSNSDENLGYNRKKVIDSYRKIQENINDIASIRGEKIAILHPQDKFPVMGKMGSLGEGVLLITEAMNDKEIFSQHGQEIVTKIASIVGDGQQYLKKKSIWNMLS